MNPNAIVLVGLSGSGKSTVGQVIARNLGWQFVDTDQLVEEETGKPVTDIFAEEGERAFRERELQALHSAIARDHVVVATGGGAPLTAEGRRAIGRGFVVWLAVSPEHAARRLMDDPDTPNRPLLEGDPQGRLRQLLDERRQLYSLADAAVDVDALTPEQCADEVIRLWHEDRGRIADVPRFGSEHVEAVRAAPEPGQAPRITAATVRTPQSTYPVFVQVGGVQQLGSVCRELRLTGRAFLVTDTDVGPLLAPTAERALEEGGYPVRTFAIPAGEHNKTLATLGSVYDWLLGERVERSDFVICLGGGIVTDLGGFAAATCLRGIDFVHVPTTSLAMVDAAVGGKTGVDHPLGKNMIGAFAQPRAVLIDPRVLATLPRRQLAAGWAEVIKHALILDPELLDDLESGESNANAMLSPDLIGRSVAIKAAVVSEDEREAGRRTLLNYGHTVGHAIEAVTGYTEYLHGEAVAIGMRAAGLISVDLGLLLPEELERQQRILRAYGLPESAPGLDPSAVFDATLSDKKVRGGSIRWVLLEGLGSATTRDGVPGDIVERAIATVLK